MHNFCDIKSSVKMLVVNNLSRIFGDSIVFAGSFCEHIYTGMSLSDVKDFDLKIKLSCKNEFIKNLLHQDFHVSNTEGKKFSVKIYKTYEKNTNLRVFKTSYVSDDNLSLKYAIGLCIMGVSIDCFFYLDNKNLLNKYKNFLIGKDDFYKTDIQTFKLKNFNIQTIENRKSFLLNNVNKNEKHSCRLSKYTSDDTFKLNKVNLIDEFKLPCDFDPTNYTRFYENLKRKMQSKDAAINHYIGWGIFENRKYI